MMRRVKRVFSMYTPDFWLFLVVLAFIAALIGFSDGSGSVRGNIYLYVFSFAAAGSVFLIQENKKKKTSPLAWFSLKAGEKFSEQLSYIDLSNYQASVFALAALLYVFAAHTLGVIVLGQGFRVIAVLIAVLTVIAVLLLVCVLRGISGPIKYLTIGVCLAFPAVITLAGDGLGAGSTSSADIWITIAITFGILLLNRKSSKRFFKLLTLALFTGILFEIRFGPETDLIKTLGLVSNVFYVGFVVFSSLDFRMERSLESYAFLENVNTELREAQTQLVQREQMVTLGQLIAGVAHEINTPIGAIKASAEMFDSLDMNKLLKDTKKYSNEQLNAIITILGLCTRSIKNMRSTRDLRRGKAEVRQFLTGIDIKQADEIATSLSGMEIVDIEKLEEHMDLFRRADILELLSFAQILKPYISSLQSISFASNGVSKIIFALKSFSHMNTTGEMHKFDVVKNIDNVLVLYHNQIKRGIEVVKLYDEEVPLIYGNVEELSQVWTNIIHNAIYAMSYVGQLTITVSNINGKTVAVSFADTGTGISQENIDKLFDPFFSTKPLGEGSGLGLDICKKVIEKHDGSIKVESKPGHGAKFTITLPVTEETALERSGIDA